MNFQKLNGEGIPNILLNKAVQLCMRNSNRPFTPANDYVIVKERHETIMGYKPRERVEWFIPIMVELLVL